jgi:hypothetical protein
MAVSRALIDGIRLVLRSPLLLVAATLIMLGAVLPFGLVLGSRLQLELSRRQPVSQAVSEIDPEWWLEFRERAEGLAATFTPAILGAAGPLDNLSSLLDGTPRPMILLVPYALSAVLWAFLWGAALARYAHGRTGFWRAGLATFLPFLAISAVAAVVVSLLYLTVHPLLFEMASRWQAAARTEQGAFAVRFIVYLLFGSLLILVSVVADYARVSRVAVPARSVPAAIADAWRFVWRNAGAVLTLYLATGGLFIALLVAHVALETYGGSRVGGWRGVAIAQAYIVARLMIRLTFGASETRLYQSLAESPQESELFENPGPPAPT